MAGCQKVIAKVVKDPAATLDYSLDWGAEWLDVADSIVASSWSISGDANSLMITDQPFTPAVATVWLSGGIAGSSYILTNHITTAAQRQDDRSLMIIVQER